MKIILYNSKLKSRAKYLRNNATEAEKIIWKKLKNKQILGFDFDRQTPIDNFIVDFYCKELSIAIEIDGSSHDDKEDYDILREEKLKDLGVIIFRFTNDEVIYSLDYVINTIIIKIKNIIKNNLI